jgi:hypothetical protein
MDVRKVGKKDTNLTSVPRGGFDHADGDTTHRPSNNTFVTLLYVAMALTMSMRLLIVALLTASLSAFAPIAQRAPSTLTSQSRLFSSSKLPSSRLTVTSLFIYPFSGTQCTYAVKIIWLTIAALGSNKSKKSSGSIQIQSPLDPLFNQLPWNARRIQEREARKVRRQVAQLHRDLGIPQDAPYEEVVAAADRAILAAGRDVKKRLVIERAKDQILTLRLNERLKGLTSLNVEARSQSTFEKDG